VKRGAGAVLAIALAVIGAGARPECAHACTCGPFDARRLLSAADAAVVGAVVERREAGARAILVLDVERRLKGPVGDRVEVATGLDSAACGVAAEPGRRVGLFLTRRGEAWEGSLCGQAEPEALAALPTATGGEEVADSFAEATAYVLAIVALAAIGVFLLRRRFHPD
jgi:hypothetical protein